MCASPAVSCYLAPSTRAASPPPGMSTIKPIVLLADSQLLFWRDEGELFLERVRGLLGEGAGSAERAPRAAYLGASNGDAPEFFQLFRAAMEQIDVRDCHHVPARPAARDLELLDGADLILLAGGEVRRGWDAFKAAGIDQKLIERYYAGALLLGVSAGAVQLGLRGWDEAGERTSDMLRLVPFVVDVHDEPGWGRLLRAVPRAGEHARGLGVPSGGGALYHPDHSVEPVRHPLVEVSQTDKGLQQALLLPGQAAAAAPAGAGPAAGGPSGAAAGGPAGAEDAGREADADRERERGDLGYSIGADGVIEIHRAEAQAAEPEGQAREPVN